MAAYGGFVLTRVEPFNPEYRKVGYRSSSKSFNASEALQHEFSFAGSPPSLSSSAQEKPDSAPPPHASFERSIRYPLEYRPHYSFWVHSDIIAVEKTLRETFDLYFTDLNVEIERLISEFSRDGRTSWCFQLKISSASYALSRTDAMVSFGEVLSERLEDKLPCFQARI